MSPSLQCHTNATRSGGNVFGELVNTVEVCLVSPAVPHLRNEGGSLGQITACLTNVVGKFRPMVRQMKRWNKETNQWEPYEAGSRTYPPLVASLKAQLDQIQSSSDGIMRYWPAQVTLSDGTTHSCVYFADASEYIKVWGVWPDDDSGKDEIKAEDVAIISPSPSRLSLKFAEQLYRAGESGMGYTVFELLYSDGSKSAHLAGNAVDFVRLPAGKQPADIVNVLPHAGRDSKAHIETPDYAWCLFSPPPGKSSLFSSLFKR